MLPSKFLPFSGMPDAFLNEGRFYTPLLAALVLVGSQVPFFIYPVNVSHQVVLVMIYGVFCASYL